MMLYTKNHGSRPCGFKQEDFFMFLPIKAYVKPVTLRQGHFWPKGYNSNKLGKSLLDDTTYKKQGSRPCGFRLEDFFMFLPIKAYIKYLTPGPGPIFSPRAII